VSKQKRGHRGQPATEPPAAHASDLATPKVILEAIFPGPGMCGSTRLQPLRITHYLALEMVQSPLLDATGVARQSTTQDIVTALAICSTPAASLFDLLELGGRAALETMVKDFAVRAPIADIRDASARIVEHCRKAFATVLPGGGGGGEDGPLSRVPPTPAPGPGS
jgi:hypothetical protein